MPGPFLVPGTMSFLKGGVGYLGSRISRGYTLPAPRMEDTLVDGTRPTRMPSGFVMCLLMSMT